MSDNRYPSVTQSTYRPVPPTNSGLTAARQDVINGRIGQALEFCHGKKAVWFADIQQMVGDTAHFFLCNFAAAQVKPAVYLPRVGRYDLSAEAERQLHAEAALAGGIGAHNGDEFFLHARSPLPRFGGIRGTIRR